MVMTSDARAHELFSRYPDREIEFPSGRRFPIPYHCYDADALVLHGTVDLAATEALLRGENCRPAALRRLGQPDRGVAQIWLNLYRDTNVGPYREVVISFAVCRDARAPVYPHRNAASLLLPGLDPRCVVFTRWLYLDSQLPIDAGREAWGFPKYRAELRFDRAGGGGEGLLGATAVTHQAISTDGKEILRMHLELGSSWSSRLQLSWQLLRTLGIRRLMGRGGSAEAASTILTPTVLQQFAVPVRAVGRPTLHRWGPRNELSFGPETEGGRRLAELGFRPALVHATTGLKFAMLAGEPLSESTP
jgi:hypothetical protein